MKNSSLYITFCLLLMFSAVAVTAGVEAPEWVDFFGNITINSNPAPVGTVVKAYDPDGIMCGSYVVSTTGSYGFLHVLRDDNTTPSIDEGADPGDTIVFTINGLDATPTVVSGVVLWTANGDQQEIDLATTATQNIAFTVVGFPQDTLGAPGHTYRFYVDIRNDGNGTDFYGVDAPSDLSGNNAWTSANQDTLSYADPSATTSVWFDITLPIFGGGFDTIHVITYTVFSEIDNGVSYTDSLIITKSTTDIGDNPWANLPDVFNLFQNYPNPFNPMTSIAFNLPRQSSVKLEIININGQIVDVVNNGILPSGFHEIEYDAGSLSSGVYFYRLITDNASLSKKMVLLK